MSTPSLLNIPYLYKAGTLYSQIPESGAGDFTVTRTTTPTAGRSTRINKDGLIELVADNVPRLDYPLGGAVNGCPALLVEPSAQNLAVQSEDFTLSASWNTSVAGRTLATGNVTATLDPYGGNVADLLSDDNTASSTHRMYTAGNISITSGTTYSTSFFVKANTTPWFEIRLMQSNEVDAGIVGTVFNLTSGTITSGSGTIQNYGNGWYRCTNIGTSNFTGNGRIFFYVYNSSGTKSYNGTSSNSLYIFGAQVETGSVATSYIPTTTAAVTRSADVISRTSASALIGQSEGTIYAEVDVRNWVNLSRIFSISDGTATNRIMTLFNTSNRFRVIIDSGGGAAQVDISSASLTNGVHKIAVGYSANDVVFYVNGVLVGSDTTVNIPACSQAFLGKIETSASSNFLNDRIRAVELHPNRLTNAQLATLTAL